MYWVVSVILIAIIAFQIALIYCVYSSLAIPLVVQVLFGWLLHNFSSCESDIVAQQIYPFFAF